jgi:hypothetical protein
MREKDQLTVVDRHPWEILEAGGGNVIIITVPENGGIWIPSGNDGVPDGIHW